MTSTILDFTKTKKGLHISLITELPAILEIIELVTDVSLSDEERFCRAIEYQICNGWNLLSDYQMAQVGLVLTSCCVLTEELITDVYGDAVGIGDYYHNINWYQIRSPWTELMNHGFVDFDLQKMDDEDKAFYDEKCAEVDAQIETETLQLAGIIAVDE
jgi:hypothetical protein